MNPGETTLPPRLREDIALLAVFLLSSGRGLLDEPADYGIYRCTDGARRALQLLDEHGASTARLTAVRERLDEVMFAPMGEDRDMGAILDDLCRQMAGALPEVETP